MKDKLLIICLALLATASATEKHTPKINPQVFIPLPKDAHLVLTPEINPNQLIVGKCSSNHLKYNCDLTVHLENGTTWRHCNLRHSFQDSSDVIELSKVARLTKDTLVLHWQKNSNTQSLYENSNGEIQIIDMSNCATVNTFVYSRRIFKTLVSFDDGFGVVFLKLKYGNKEITESIYETYDVNGDKMDGYIALADHNRYLQFGSSKFELGSGTYFEAQPISKNSLSTGMYIVHYHPFSFRPKVSRVVDGQVELLMDLPWQRESRLHHNDRFVVACAENEEDSKFTCVSYDLDNNEGHQMSFNAGSSSRFSLAVIDVRALEDGGILAFAMAKFSRQLVVVEMSPREPPFSYRYQLLNSQKNYTVISPYFISGFDEHSRTFTFTYRAENEYNKYFLVSELFKLPSH